MAIGARITSTNLSGKTATVTFVSYTGSTSGNTVNLGTKTVPFNHINSHPYGIYSLHFAEYDYTYTLTVPEPEAQGVQMLVHSNRMVGSNNYGVGTLNFNDFTAEVIDLDININDWNNSDIEYVTESGFMYYFRGVSNGNDRLVIFTDSSNNEIERYSGTTDSFSRNTLEGRWTTAEFVDLGVLKYSDGISVYTYTWDPSTHYLDIEWDWDASTSDGTLIFRKNELGSWNYNGNGESYIVNPNDGTTTLFKTWTDGTYVRHKMNRNSNFIVVETQNQASGNTYTNLEICDLDGTVLETVSLTGQTYNNYYNEFHGANKYTTIFYNSDDADVDYKIIHYNGNTNNLIETSHVRGVNYSSINTIARDNTWPSTENLTTGGIVIVFYNSTANDNIGTVTTYCDFVYMLNNQTTFNTYTFANNTTKSFSTWGTQLSDIIRFVGDNGDGILSCITITSGTTRVESLEISISGITSLNSRYLNNKTVAQIMTNNNTTVNYKYINAIGAVTDSVFDDLTGYFNTSMDSAGEVSYVTMQTSTNGNIAYYLYGNNVDFNTTTYYEHRQTPNYYDSVEKEYPDVMFLYSEGGVNGRVLSSTGVTSEFQIPAMSNYNVSVGKDKIFIVYQDSSDNNYIKFNLYNFSGTLLSSTDTTYTSWNNVYTSKDRYVVQFIDGGNIVFYSISENGVTSVTLQDYDGQTYINDYVYYD